VLALLGFDDEWITGNGSLLECLWAIQCHHLLKTFWDGWTDRQLPDGTVIWTAPDGRTSTTQPGSRILFPTLCLPTGALSPPRPGTLIFGNRGAMMPVRRRTRAQDRARRIAVERALNDAHVAERNHPPPF
jgi:hypothetical protein